MESRRCLYSCQIMATEIYDDVSVTDVYDQAAGIAREFDKLISVYGSDSVTELMPKVIRALENLELLATRYEKDNDEIAQLRVIVDKLESEKAGKAQERAKFEQDLVLIEENWQSEVKDLLGVVSKLQEENKRLKDNLQNEKSAVAERVTAKHRETEEQEIKVLTKLKETVDKQREELRAIRREMQQKSVDCDALSAQLERIAKINSDLRRKNNTQKKQAKVLLEEKAELEVALLEKETHVEKIRIMMSEQEKFEEQRAAVRAAIAHQRESEDTDDGDNHLPAEDGGSTTTASTTDEDSIKTDSTTSPISPGLDLAGKMIIDMKDPNRPRFTLQELREVLMERNELKTRLIEVEEELNHFRPREPAEQGEDSQSDSKSSYSGEDVLVYGPINKEPEEKLHGRKESGIRKLFNFLFGDGPSPAKSNVKRSQTFSR